MDELKKKFNDMARDLAEMDPKDKDFIATANRLKEVQEILLREQAKDDRSKAATIEADEKIKAAEVEAEGKIKVAKTEAIWGFFGRLLGGVVGIGSILLLINIKDTQGMVDKDVFSISKVFMPRM